MFTAKDYDKALLTPESVFASPMEVVNTSSLTPEQKMAVLKRWEAEATHLEMAENESMAASPEQEKDSRLREIGKAMLELSRKEDVDENTVIQTGSSKEAVKKSD